MRVTSRLADAEALAVRVQTLGLSPVAGASEAFFSVFRPDTDSDEDEGEAARVASARVVNVLEREARAEVTRERARGAERAGLDDLSSVLNAPSPSSLSQALLAEP